ARLAAFVGMIQNCSIHAATIASGQSASGRSERNCGIGYFKMSKAEETLAIMMDDANIEYQREYRFAAEHVGMGAGIRQRLEAAGIKDWRADFCIVGVPLLVEVEGVTHYGRNKNG